MGFTSRDNWIKNQTNLGVGSPLQSVHAEWNKFVFGGYTIGRWYDLNLCYGIPPYCSYGELLLNSGPWQTANNWQLNTQWAYSPTTYFAGAFVRSSGGGGNLTQTGLQSSLQNGRTYSVVWILNSVASGSITVYLNGVASVYNRSANNSCYAENITVGSGTGGLSFNASSTSTTATIGSAGSAPVAISVFETLQSFPLLDTNSISGALYHGGNVSPLSKHIFNMGIFTATATFNPGNFLLCDFLMAYPGIDLNSTSVQNLLNNNTLPRYTDGAGVMAFLVVNNAYPTGLTGMYSGSTILSYTNSSGASGRSMPVQVDNTVAANVGQLINTGLNRNNYSPFLPLAQGDTGIRSVQSIQFSAASDNPYRTSPGPVTLATLVLVKPLAYIPYTSYGQMAERDLMYQLPSLPKVEDGAFLGFLFHANASIGAYAGVNGYIDFSWA